MIDKIKKWFVPCDHFENKVIDKIVTRKLNWWGDAFNTTNVLVTQCTKCGKLNKMVIKT